MPQIEYAPTLKMKKSLALMTAAATKKMSEHSDVTKKAAKLEVAQLK